MTGADPALHVLFEKLAQADAAMRAQKEAKALGLAVPPVLLASADGVIE